MGSEATVSMTPEDKKGVKTMSRVFITFMLLLSLATLLCLTATSCSSGSSNPDGDQDQDAASDGDVEEDSEQDAEIADGDPDTDKEEEQADGDPEEDQEMDEETFPPGSLKVSPDPIDFGTVDINSSKDVVVNIENDADTGSETIDITLLELTMSTSNYITLKDCNAGSTLESGEKQNCTISCNPASPGEATGQLRVLALSENGDPLEQRVDIICNSNISVLAVNSATVEFGYVKPGKVSYKYFSFTNAGLDPLNITAFGFMENSSDTFSIVNTSKATLTGEFTSGNGQYFELRFEPTAEEQYIAWLKISSTSFEGQRIVPIIGRGTKVCPEGMTAKGDTCLAECIPKAQKCSTSNETSFKVCNDSGNSWGDAQNCAAGTKCIDGYCALLVCQPGVSFCKDNKYQTCPAKGEETGLIEDCSDDEHCSNICMPASGCNYPEDNNYCNDQNPCTDDVCTKGEGCSTSFNTESCEDNNACTKNSTCVRGFCVGEQIFCNDDNQCTEDSCDPLTGCVFESIEGGCSDNDACTVNERCESGQCVGDIRTCNDNNDCTADACDTITGCTFTPTGLSCDDGNPCTVNDTCATEQCMGEEKNWDDGLYCNGPFDLCNPELPEGSNITHPNPVICNDHISCTTDDICDEELDTCVYTADNTKCDDNNPCTIDTCDLVEDCTHQKLADFTTCDILAGIDEVCLNGFCVAGCTEDWQCQDGISCTSDSCDKENGYCSHEAFDDLCDNNIFCDGEEICDITKDCISGTPPDCSDNLSCTRDFCDEESDSCQHETRNSYCNDFNDCTVNVCDIEEGCRFIPRDGACDDNDPCTLNDACSAGSCVGGSEILSCNDNNICTDDECIPGYGCRNENFNTIECDDNDVCTSFDKCTSGICVGTSIDCDDGIFCNGSESCSDTGCTDGQSIICNDNVECTTDQCSEDLFGCEFVPDDSKCSDDNVCTENERCTTEGCAVDFVEDGTDCGNDMACYNGVCVISCTDDSECDDNIVCTDNICDPETSHCKFIVNNENCSDGIFCNGYELCDTEQDCIDGTPPNCDDEIECTVDNCDEENNSCLHDAEDSLCNLGGQCKAGKCDLDKGCTYIPLNQACDDELICTVNDFCVDGVCIGDPDTCDDNNPCTQDYCDNTTGCQHTNLQNGILCGSGIVDRLCMNGECIEGCINDNSCDDGIACTVDNCDVVSRQCNFIPLDELCNDGNDCNGLETCDTNLGCISDYSINCDDSNPCTIDSCDPESGQCVNEQTVTGIACEDNNVCTLSSACNFYCEALETRVCPDDNNECTIADCNPSTGCTNVPAEDNIDCNNGGRCLQGYCAPQCNGDCNDNNVCTENDTCIDGYCQGSIINCNDNNACTDDSCNSATGCVFNISENGLPCTMETGKPGQCNDGNCVNLCSQNSDCDDQNNCTEDSCTELGCVHITNTNLCDDNNGCTTDICTATGCEYQEHTNSCDDGNLCTTNDTCTNGECIGNAIDYNDNNKCTDDFCDPLIGVYHVDVSDKCQSPNPCINAVCIPENGCEYVDLKTPCDDENACTLYDSCETGECGSLIERDCNDNNECTIDNCDSKFGCTHENVENLQVCQIVEGAEGVCLSGICRLPCNSDEHCADLVSCTDDVCNLETGYCEHVTHDDACDDQIFCNGNEQCLPYFGCVAGDAIDCDDGIDCTSDTCVESEASCIYTPVNNACDDENACTSDTCDAVLGCTHENLSDNACDDGLNCTIMDSCNNGICQGQQRDCDDNNTCTGPDSCDETLGCFNPPLEDNLPCLNDGICQQGQCAQLCENDFDCDDDIACTVDFCDSTSGRCRHSANNNYCDDGLYCNGTESCNTSFGCMPGMPIVCNDGFTCTVDYCDENSRDCAVTTNDAICNDGNPCTINKCEEGIGCVNDENNIIPCDDGNPCTTGDFCTGGECNGHEGELQCPFEENGCQYVGCDPRVGCIRVVDNDKQCNGDACARQATCNFGECVTTLAIDCEGDNPCLAYSCHPVEGCKSEVLHLSDCNDYNACTINDSCNMSSCEGSTRDCNDNNDCTVDDCDTETGCTHSAKDDQTACQLTGGGSGVCRNGYCANSCTGSCNDNNACTTNDNCNAGYCEGNEISCDDSNPCTEDSCDIATGCVNNALTDQTPCSVDNKAGQCLAGSCEIFCELDSDCNDQNPCTSETCDPAIGCSYEFTDNVACQPESKCAVDGICLLGECRIQTEKQCDDLNSCTEDSCDPATGCIFENSENGKACNDLIACTFNDTCNAGVCTGEFVNCDDQNDCTEDLCTNDGTCDNIPLTGNSCNDDNLCTSVSACVMGICEGLQEIDCDDQNPCTVDECNPLSGCSNEPRSGMSCDDENICTAGDTCNSGTCESGSATLNCSDDDPCTADTCDSELGCLNTPMQDNEICDINPNVKEVCLNGLCEEYCDSNSDCNDNIDCTVDECNPDNHSCTFSSDHISCDDGVFCNGAEYCDMNFGCTEGMVPECDDQISCTDDICDTQDDQCVSVPQDYLCDDDNACTIDTCSETNDCQHEEICSR